MERREIKPCPCDLSTGSLQYAIESVGLKPRQVRVHPWDANLARHFLYNMGLGNVPVVIDDAFKADEWAVQFSDIEIHSDGA